MAKEILINENISLGLAYRFSGLVHYHHGGEHGGRQAGRHSVGDVLRAPSDLPGKGLAWHGLLTSQSQPLVMHFLQ